MRSLVSSDVMRLLTNRHKEDVFVAPCRTDRTLGSRHWREFDAWVAIRGQAPRFVGYEIKVSRQDFLRDEKWRDYLPFCHEMYFACPQGIIDPAELPADVGLFHVSAGGARLLLKRKAVYREIEPPIGVLLYVLFNRTAITRKDIDPDARDNIAFWQHWLEAKHEKLDLGRSVSRKIRQTVDERVTKVEREQQRLNLLCDSYADIRRLLVTELGFTPESLKSSPLVRQAYHTLQRRHAEAMTGVSAELRHGVRNLLEKARQMQAIVDEVEKAAQQAAGDKNSQPPA